MGPTEGALPMQERKEREHAAEWRRLEQATFVRLREWHDLWERSWGCVPLYDAAHELFAFLDAERAAADR